jgi:recombinational DNA repair protein (RecF pathway)
MRCEICGTDLSRDLFSVVTGERVCSICILKFIGGLPPTQDRINVARVVLGLAKGEYYQQDNGKEAGRILRREAL